MQKPFTLQLADCISDPGTRPIPALGLFAFGLEPTTLPDDLETQREP